MTIMTSGANGEYRTAFGMIEFHPTDNQFESIKASLKPTDYDNMWFADVKLSLDDFKKLYPGAVHNIDMETYEICVEDGE